MMIRVGIDEIKPGMILAHPVKNNQGVLLLDAGAKITKKNIRIFKSWGVAEVTIKGGTTQGKGSAGSQQLRVNAFDEVNLKEKFADVLDDPVMVEIFKAASRQLNKDKQGDDAL
jgi:hypothetical protein